MVLTVAFFVLCDFVDVTQPTEYDFIAHVQAFKMSINKVSNAKSHKYKKKSTIKAPSMWKIKISEYISFYKL